jgi:hypothetical protein
MTEHEQEEQRIPKRDHPGAGPERIALDLAARTVVAVFDHFDHAQAAAHDLRAVGFRSADISLVMRQSGAVPERGAGATQADEGTAAGATIGAVIGGIAGLAALSIPGIGPLLAAGPIAAALGALTGSALGGLIGSFTGLGIPTEHAKDYDAAVRAGGIVIAVRAADRSADERANRILHQHGAREVASYSAGHPR